MVLKASNKHNAFNYIPETEIAGSEVNRGPLEVRAHLINRQR